MGGAEARHTEWGAAGDGAGSRRRLGAPAVPPPPAASPTAPPAVAALPLPPDDTPLSGPRPTRGVAVSREVREL
jgi:hypothetical protein